MADGMRGPSGREAEQGPIDEAEVRLDQLTGQRTILSPARADRRFDFSGIPTEPHPEAAEDCPFDQGREDRTPPETWANRPGGGEPDSPGWLVRAVPNLYPALAQTWNGAAGSSAAGTETAADEGVTPAADPLRSAARGREPDLFRASPATGFHEAAADDRQCDLCPRQGQLPRPAVGLTLDADPHLGPFRALDLVGRLGAALAGDRVAVDRNDRVADPDPGLIRRRSLEDLHYPQPALDRDDAEADPGEAPFDRLPAEQQRVRCHQNVHQGNQAASAGHHHCSSTAGFGCQLTVRRADGCLP